MPEHEFPDPARRNFHVLLVQGPVILTTSLLGLLVGLILAITGARGGILAVPLLVFDTGISVAQAGPIALASSGGLAGFLSGLLGVGGGFVMPALRRSTDLPPARAVATSLTVIALLSATGATAAALQGAMFWPTAAPFAAGTLAGMLAGGKLATRMAGPQQQRAVAAVTVLVALGMIGKTLF